jgi:hypothetical protein
MGQALSPQLRFKQDFNRINLYPRENFVVILLKMYIQDFLKCPNFIHVLPVPLVTYAKREKTYFASR